MLGKLVGKLIFLFFSICDQNMGYFRKLYAELFTSKSRGGAVVLLIFFYTSYVVAAVLWRDRGLFEFYYDPSGLTNGTAGDWHCVTLRSCWVNVLRLSFYDGNGFDLLSSILYAGQWHLFLLILTYMVFTGIILLNGLLGIFSHAFERDGAPPAPMPPGLDPKRAEGLQALRGRLEDLHRQSHEMLILFDASMRPRPAAPTTSIGRMRKQATEIVLSVDQEHSLEVRVAAAAFYVAAFLLSVAEPIVIGCGSKCDPHQNIQARAASVRATANVRAREVPARLPARLPSCLPAACKSIRFRKPLPLFPGPPLPVLSSPPRAARARPPAQRAVAASAARDRRLSRGGCWVGGLGGGGEARQAGLLAVSTLLFFLSVPVTAYLSAHALRELEAPGLRPLAVLCQPASLFEGACLLIGWVCLYRAPGFASLRCFRVFRALWNLELFAAAAEADADADVAAGGEGRQLLASSVAILALPAHLCLRYFRRLGGELALQRCGAARQGPPAPARCTGPGGAPSPWRGLKRDLLTPPQP